MRCKVFLFLLIALFQSFILLAQVRYGTNNGTVHFKSDAPLELIEAASNALKGIIDTERNAFAFSIEMNSFQGFNSPLQRVHFNENYLETKKFPKATFTGKIIEAVDWDTNGSYDVRTKGKLEIHGIEQERILRGTIHITKGKIKIKSTFTVLLDEHQISVPKIMFQKIAGEIRVNMEADLEKQN